MVIFKTKFFFHLVLTIFTGLLTTFVFCQKDNNAVISNDNSLTPFSSSSTTYNMYIQRYLTQIDCESNVNVQYYQAYSVDYCVSGNLNTSFLYTYNLNRQYFDYIKFPNSSSCTGPSTITKLSPGCYPSRGGFAIFKSGNTNPFDGGIHQHFKDSSCQILNFYEGFISNGCSLSKSASCNVNSANNTAALLINSFNTTACSGPARSSQYPIGICNRKILALSCPITCFGKSATDISVCNRNGKCLTNTTSAVTGIGICVCNVGFSGVACDEISPTSTLEIVGICVVIGGCILMVLGGFAMVMLYLLFIGRLKRIPMKQDQAYQIRIDELKQDLLFYDQMNVVGGDSNL